MNVELVDALWYLGRGSGAVLLVLFSLVVALGVGTRRGRPAFGLPRFAVTAVHRAAGLMALAFLAVHVSTMVVDPYAQVELVDVVVPFVAGYRPVWLGLGTLTLDLAVAVVVTSLLRNRLGQRTWKAVHLTAYAVWPLAVSHALGTGTDSGSAWMLVLCAVSGAAVLAAAVWRVGVVGGRDAAGRLRPGHASEPRALTRSAS